jgi:hypothetical protein
MGSGKAFGELAINEKKLRTATILTLSPAELGYMSKSSYCTVIQLIEKDILDSRV